MKGAAGPDELPSPRGRQTTRVAARGEVFGTPAVCLYHHERRDDRYIFQVPTVRSGPVSAWPSSGAHKRFAGLEHGVVTGLW